MAMSLPFTISRRAPVPAEQSTGFGAIAERFRRAGDLERAVALCQEGLQKFPEHLSARVTLGWAFLDLGRHDEARSELERVIRRAPDNLAAIRGLAALHDRMESADVEHMDAASTSWPPPSYAVPVVAPQVVTAPETIPEVHVEVPVEETRLEDLPLFKAAAQQEQEEAFHQRHAYEAPAEHVQQEAVNEQEPSLPFDAAPALPVQAPAPIDEFDPVFPIAAVAQEHEPVAASFDEPIAPIAFEMPVERSTSALEAEFALAVPQEVHVEETAVAEPAHMSALVSAVEPIAVAEPVQRPEPVQVAETAPVVEPVHVHAAEPVQVAEAVQVAEPVQMAEPVTVAEPVQMPEPALVAEAVHVAEPVLAAEPVYVAEPVQVPEPLHLEAEPEPLLLTIDDEPRPVGSVTIEPVIDEPLTLDDAMPLTLDVEAIAVEDAAAFGSEPAAHVVFPVRMQPAKPALVALEKLLRRVEDRKLAALAGSLAS